jgi:type IV pilus assembly protein PilA
MLARIRKAMDEREEGFTLIELLVVIIIIGILAAIAIPVFLNQRQKGYDAQVKADLRNAATAEETYLTDNPTTYTTDLSTAGALISSGWRRTTGVKIGASIITNTGFCLIGLSQSGRYFEYDSTAGGLQSTNFGTTAPVVGQTAANGSCTGTLPTPS